MNAVDSAVQFVQRFLSTAAHLDPPNALTLPAPRAARGFFMPRDMDLARRSRYRLFGRPRNADLSDRIDHATAAIFRRLNLPENAEG